jgi:hypothetical protein
VEARQATNLMVALGVATVVIVVAGLAAAFRSEAPLPTAGARVHLDGQATVVRADGTAEQLADGDVVHPGDEVEVVSGTAVLELAAGGTVEGRARRGEVAGTLLEVGAPVRLLAGDLLAEGTTGVAVEAAGTRVVLDGDDPDRAARIRRGLAVTTATYRGAATIDSAGEHRAIPALRQLSVASVGRPASDAEPIRADATDPWDLRYLGGAIDLTRRLDALSRSFTAAGLTRASAADYEALLPALADEPSFDTVALRADRLAGETVVGAAIAVLADGGEFEHRWDEVFAFRDAGAAWGLVALELGVGDTPVLELVQAALDRATTVPTGEVAASVPGSLPSEPASTAGSTPNPEGGTTPAGGDPSAPTVPPTTTPLLPPTTSPPTTPTLPPPPTPEEPIPDTGSDLLDELVEPVEDLLGGLLGDG